MENEGLELEKKLPERKRRLQKVLSIYNISIAGFLLSLGILFPLVFHILKIGGNVFLPMHLPVLIAGFFLPWELSGLVGLLSPLLSFFFTSMPPVPTVFTMMGELLVYGALTSLLFHNARLGIYPALILSMIVGRFVSLLLNWLIISLVVGKNFDFLQVASALFVAGLPGILIQLVLIPLLVKLILKEPSLVRSQRVL
ncbi:MAG: ECF transporter S component [Coprothermobacterota bacterium]|nr:ECF transporter S component [Coprothermobacterota bacterium]